MALDITKWYSFDPTDGGNSCIVRRGEGAPKITGGGARWKIVNRPKRTSITLYDGIDPYTMDVPVIFDGYIEELSVEFMIGILNQWRFSKQALAEPTKVRITGGVPVKGATWFISDITWGDNVYYTVNKGKGDRQRQDAVIHLTQYVDEVALKGIKEFKITDKVITVKKGQDIHHMSGGNPKTKKAIQKKNGIRDVKTIGKKPGQKIKVPVNTDTGPKLEPGPQVSARPGPDPNAGSYPGNRNPGLGR
jgi:hypothetical protein